MACSRRTRRLSAAIQDLLHGVMLVLAGLTLVLFVSGAAGAPFQPGPPGDPVPLINWRLDQLEAQVKALQADATSISRLLIGLLVAVVGNMVLYVATRRRELRREEGEP